MFQPIWKIIGKLWIISPSRGKNTTSIKPPPRKVFSKQTELASWLFIILPKDIHTSSMDFPPSFLKSTWRSLKKKPSRFNWIYLMSSTLPKQKKSPNSPKKVPTNWVQKTSWKSPFPFPPRPEAWLGDKAKYLPKKPWISGCRNQAASGRRGNKGVLKKRRFLEHIPSMYTWCICLPWMVDFCSKCR